MSYISALGTKTKQFAYNECPCYTECLTNCPPAFAPTTHPMLHPPSLAFPSTHVLPSSYRVPSTTPWVHKAVVRLSPASLLTLVQAWLRPESLSTCAPYLAKDETEQDGLYPAAQSLEELRELYIELEKGREGKKGVVDRILEGDWRHGISLRQIAMADVQYLLDHPTSQRWTALRLARITSNSINESNDSSGPEGTTSFPLPRFHAPIFLRNLQKEIGGLVKGHYYLTRLASLPVTLLRIQTHESPYSNRGLLVTSSTLNSINASHPIYIAFPDNTPHIYISILATPGIMKKDGGTSYRKIVIDAIPKAFSRPQERYAVKTTSLSARSLSALAAVRGSGRDSMSAGRWSVFADGSAEESPLVSTFAMLDSWQDGQEDKENVLKPKTHTGAKRSRENIFERTAMLAPEDEVTQKARRDSAVNRFGESGIEADSKGIERFDVRVKDALTVGQSALAAEDEVHELMSAALPKAQLVRRGRRSTLDFIIDSDEDPDDNNTKTSSKAWAPTVQMTFHGSHVFAGIRRLVESGAIDAEKMPGWMTGENGVSIGVIKDGRIKGLKGLET